MVLVNNHRGEDNNKIKFKNRINNPHKSIKLLNNHLNINSKSSNQIHKMFQFKFKNNSHFKIKVLISFNKTNPTYNPKIPINHNKIRFKTRNLNINNNPKTNNRLKINRDNNLSKNNNWSPKNQLNKHNLNKEMYNHNREENMNRVNFMNAQKDAVDPLIKRP